MAKSTRHKAREVALQSLYWAESTGEPIERACHQTSREMGLSDDLLPFVLSLTQKALERRDDFGEMIADVCEHWRLDRIARIDRLILLMALTEVFCLDDVPLKVAMDEAIELARQFSSPEAPAFVNGILDAVARKACHADISGARR